MTQSLTQLLTTKTESNQNNSVDSNIHDSKLHMHVCLKSTSTLWMSHMIVLIHFANI